MFCTIPISVDVEFLLRLRDICSKFPFTKHIFIALSNNATMLIQLNKYETAPNFIQLNQNLTSTCLFDHKIVLQTKQFYDHIMQELVKTGEFS